jgi:hypothetical protein
VDPYLVGKRPTRVLRLVRGLGDPQTPKKVFGHIGSAAWALKAMETTCNYCGFMGHYSKYCDDPHLLCWAKMDGSCKVHLAHRHFTPVEDGKCPYKGRRTKRQLPTH